MNREHSVLTAANGRGPACDLYCPSARPEMEGAVIFGVVEGTAGEPRVAYLTAPVEATPEVLAMAEPVTPTEVFRFAAPCATTACQHFDGVNCRLAQRTVDILPAVLSAPPPCRIRPVCRWWKQEGVAACMRCPQVVTDNYAPTAIQLRAAGIDDTVIAELEVGV
jgi:hypothetical protein